MGMIAGFNSHKTPIIPDFAKLTGQERKGPKFAFRQYPAGYALKNDVFDCYNRLRFSQFRFLNGRNRRNRNRDKFHFLITMRRTAQLS